MKNTSANAFLRGHPARPPKVVDIHAHVGVHNKYPWLGTDKVTVVLDRAARAGVDLSVISHLDGLYRTPANRKLLQSIENRDDALMWCVVDPRSEESIREFRELAAHPKVVGIKIGPTYHQYQFSLYAKVLMELAAETDSAILTHSGEANDPPAEIVKWANRYPAVRIVIAHFGNCDAYQGHLKAMRRCVSPNCIVDTSSAVSMVSDHLEIGVRELGVERFAFGSDSPLYSVAAQCVRILEADLTLRQKRTILGGNAVRFLRLSGPARKPTRA